MHSARSFIWINMSSVLCGFYNFSLIPDQNMCINEWKNTLICYVRQLQSYFVLLTLTHHVILLSNSWFELSIISLNRKFEWQHIIQLKYRKKDPAARTVDTFVPLKLFPTLSIRWILFRLLWFCLFLCQQMKQ